VESETPALPKATKAMASGAENPGDAGDVLGKDAVANLATVGSVARLMAHAPHLRARRMA
jgi:hypothetical protein